MQVFCAIKYEFYIFLFETAFFRSFYDRNIIFIDSYSNYRFTVTRKAYVNRSFNAGA